MEQSLIDTLNAYIEKKLDTQLDTSKEDHNPLSSLEDYIYLNHLPSFRELLFNLIDESNALDSDVLSGPALIRQTILTCGYTRIMTWILTRL